MVRRCARSTTRVAWPTAANIDSSPSRARIRRMHAVRAEVGSRVISYSSERSIQCVAAGASLANQRSTAMGNQQPGFASTASGCLEAKSQMVAPSPCVASARPSAARTVAASSSSLTATRRATARERSPRARSSRTARTTLALARDTSTPPATRRRRVTSAIRGWIRYRTGSSAPSEPIRRELVRWRQPAHQQSRGLQHGEDLLSPGVVGEMPCGGRADDLLAGQAQQQVALAWLECGEDLGGDLVGHRCAAGGVPVGGRERVRGGGDRASGQDHEGAPALGPLEDRLEHRRVLGARVLDDQSGGLGRVHAQELAAKGRGVPEELRHQPGERQVPSGEQQQPHVERCLVQAVVDHAQRGGG